MGCGVPVSLAHPGRAAVWWQNVWSHLRYLPTSPLPIFGADWAFLDAVPAGTHYFASIRSDTLVFRTRPRVGIPRYRGRGRKPPTVRVPRGRAQTVATLAASPRLSLDPGGAGGRGEGADPGRGRRPPGLPGPGRPAARHAGLALPAPPGGRPAQGRLLECPGRPPLVALCRAATLRWPIDQCFQDGKSQVGMDHYEQRSWPAWHRHMLYVCLALHFLLRLRHQFKPPPRP